MTVDEASRRGMLERTATSQLMVISDEAYRAGLDRIAAENGDLHGSGFLRVDLRLYGTIAWVR